MAEEGNSFYSSQSEGHNFARWRYGT